jgi:hypothetical protein
MQPTPRHAVAVPRLQLVGPRRSDVVRLLLERLVGLEDVDAALMDACLQGD